MMELEMMRRMMRVLTTMILIVEILKTIMIFEDDGGVYYRDYLKDNSPMNNT